MSQIVQAVQFTFNDGGRLQAGFKGTARDCVARAIAIVTERSYAQVYAELAKANSEVLGVKSARNGLSKAVYEPYLLGLGFKWYPAPKLTGRKARCADLPQGRLIARQAHHLVAVIDGVAHDTNDTTSKMVYGYWAK